MKHQLSVHRVFCAAHAIVMKGVRETTHGHSWALTLTVGGDALDSDGLLCDFHLLERVVDEVIAPFQNADLNSTPPFDRMNPTAEHVARHIAESVAARLPRGVRLLRAAVVEAPGCEASYVP